MGLHNHGLGLHPHAEVSKPKSEPKYICSERLRDRGQPKLGVLPVDQGAWTSCFFESFLVHGGSSPRAPHRKPGLGPQELPTDENSKVAKVRGAQLQGEPHSRSAFGTRGLEDGQQQCIISRQRPTFSVQITWFPFNFYTSSFPASSDLTQ